MKFRYLSYFFLVTLASGSFTGCAQRVKTVVPADTLAKVWDRTIPGSFSGQSKLVFDSTKLVSFFKDYPALRSYQAQVGTFYSNRKYAYAWFDDGQLIEQAGNLANRLANLENDGVYRDVAYQKELDSLLHRSGLSKKSTAPDIALELMLTAQYFVFAQSAWGGMNTAASRSSGWFLPRKKLAYDQYLDSLLKEPAGKFASGAPVYRQYDLLRTFLKKYRVLADGGNWQPIVVGKKKPSPGDSSRIVAQLKSRLFKLEDFHGDTLNQVYNDDLVKALQQFQERHGLPANGLADKATMAAMNVPIANRIKQILVNMERSRWLPVSLSSDYLAVNIPEFKLHVYHADSLLWSCNVVVGQTVHPTTVFYGEVKYVVFSPYWNVPTSIIRNEILPGLKKDPDYIAHHDMEIIGRQDGLPVIRQKPGPTNSLGLVKFLFPNSYNIYLHDTPSKSLFGETSRAFSHGCIRIVEPVKLANFLLKDSKDWGAEKIDIAMHAGKEQYVTLAEKVPVFIAYFTAFTDRNNRLNFRKDIYDLDGHLAAMLLSGNDNY